MSLVAENIKRIKAVRITPQGHLVHLTGRNGAGKTSVLDAISYVLEGLEAENGQRKKAREILREGANEGFAELDLGEFIVTRTFGRNPNGKKGTTNLYIKDKSNRVITEPQKLLDKLMSHVGFDPFKFMRMLPDEQAEHLRKLVGLDIEELQREEEQTYNERTIARRDLKAAEAQLEGLEKPLPDLPAKPIDLTSITDKMQSALARNQAIEETKRQIEEMQRNAKTAEDNAHARRAHINQLLAQIKDDEAAEAKAMQEAEQWRARAAERFPVHEPVDIAQIGEELKNAEATNSQIRKRDTYNVVDTQRAGLAAQAETLDAKYKETQRKQAEAMANVKFPIEGLSFSAPDPNEKKDKGQVMYQGKPLFHASSAEQLRVSTSIAIASNPKLRVIRISDGSLLDEDSLKLLHDMAVEHDCQIWIESVDTSGEVGIVLEDGEVVRVNPERPATKTTKKKRA